MYTSFLFASWRYFCRRRSRREGRLPYGTGRPDICEGGGGGGGERPDISERLVVREKRKCRRRRRRWCCRDKRCGRRMWSLQWSSCSRQAPSTCSSWPSSSPKLSLRCNHFLKSNPPLHLLQDYEAEYEEDPNAIEGLPASAADLLDAPYDYGFNCDQQDAGYGYYADVNNACKVFHICVPIYDNEGSLDRMDKYSFVCGEGTQFDQSTLTCNYPEVFLIWKGWDNFLTITIFQFAFPCEESPSLYGAVEFGKIPDDYWAHVMAVQSKSWEQKWRKSFLGISELQGRPDHGGRSVNAKPGSDPGCLILSLSHLIYVQKWVSRLPCISVWSECNLCNAMFVNNNNVEDRNNEEDKTSILWRTKIMLWAETKLRWRF